MPQNTITQAVLLTRNVLLASGMLSEGKLVRMKVRGNYSVINNMVETSEQVPHQITPDKCANFKSWVFISLRSHKIENKNTAVY